MHKKEGWFFILCFLPVFSFGQNIYKPDFISFEFQSGYLLKNYPQFPEVKHPSYLFGIHAGNKLAGKKHWNQFYNYADFGFNAAFGFLGNKEVLGNIVAFLPEMAFHHKLSDRWHWAENIGFGISYFNKPFNEVVNPLNIAIGSHFTFCASVSLNFEYKIKEALFFVIRPCIYHSSNSHTSLPNVGINLPLIGVGLKYFPHNEPTNIFQDTLFAYDKKIHFNIRLGLGMNEQGGSTGPVNGPKFPIYVGTIFLSRQISAINKLQLGFEGWYNTGVYDYIISQDFYSEHQKLKSMALVLLIGHEFLMGHFSLVTQGGIYLYNPFYKEKLKRDNARSTLAKLKTIFPARIGYQYYLFDATVKQRYNFFAGVYIKTNLGQADFLDTAIGCTF